MLAAIRSAAVFGIDAYDVCVEVDVASGLPHWTIVGLPAGEVKESRERVSAALANSGYALPARRITVSLSPGDLRKAGCGFDLPIAIGLLVATRVLSPNSVDGLTFLGELGLDGEIRAVRGVLSVARRLSVQGKVRALVIPPANVNEAGLVRSLTLAACGSLRELVVALQAGDLPIAVPIAPQAGDVEAADFGDVVGQPGAKRALEIAAAGGHACLLIGPPGAGKTMLARRVPSILPRLTDDEAIEVTAIHSIAGLLASSVALTARPFRAPHHSISTGGLVGGGGVPRPGEVSLAHHGVLFLDELLEFPRSALEALRQPLEDGRVVIARAAMSVAFPASFSLIAAMNPCPCGNAGEPTRVCRCTDAEIVRYRARLSGPLADRIDMHVTLGAVSATSLQTASDGESSAVIRERVEASRAIQRERFATTTSVGCNAHASGRWLLSHGRIDGAARDLLTGAMESLKLSARGYHRVLRVARTIADLELVGEVGPAHVAEALRYRPGEHARLGEHDRRCPSRSTLATVTFGTMPEDPPANNKLLALGTAAVLAVFGAGFVRTQPAADRFKGESRRRHPVAAVTAPTAATDANVSTPTAPVVTEHAAPKAAQAASVRAEKKPDTTKVISVAEQPVIKAAPVVADTASARAPVDSAMVARDLKDGVYTGWGTSRHGDIEARIEIKNGRIISASISQCLTMYSVYWIAGLPPQVVKRQSPEVDFVSGATESTNAFYDGIVEALKKAK